MANQIPSLPMPNFGNNNLSGSFNPFGSMVGNSIGSLLGGLFGGNSWSNPADAAMPYLDKIPDTLKPYYSPYIDAGKNALSQLTGQYGNLINDPSGFLNALGKGYQQSPGYQYSVDQATKAANNAAAAGGMLGTPAEQASLSKTVTGLANQDYNSWLNNALGLYQTGLNGTSDINHMGYNASDQMAQSLLSMLMSQASLANAGQQNANANSSDMWGSLGGLGGLIGGLF